MVVDVGDSDRRMLGPQDGHELGGRKRGAAEREEIAVGVDRDRAELLTPVAASSRSAGVSVGVVLGRPRPGFAGGGHGSALRSTLPDVASGNSSSTTISGTRLAGIRSAATGADVLGVEVTGDVTDQQLVAAADSRTTVHAPCTPGTRLSTPSTSPSSIRRPPILTWWSRARRTRVRQSVWRTMSPVR